MPVDVRYQAARSFDVPVSVLCNNLAHEELKWVPSTSMREGIARTVTWIKSELAKLDA